MSSPDDLRAALIEHIADRHFLLPSQAAFHADALMAEFIAPLIARAAAAEATIREREAEIERLKDPVAVHVSMMRGTIAMPSVENIVHLYGRKALWTALALAQPATLTETGGGE